MDRASDNRPRSAFPGKRLHEQEPHENMPSAPASDFLHFPAYPQRCAPARRGCNAGAYTVQTRREAFHARPCPFPTLPRPRCAAQSFSSFRPWRNIRDRLGYGRSERRPRRQSPAVPRSCHVPRGMCSQCGIWFYRTSRLYSPASHARNASHRPAP